MVPSAVRRAVSILCLGFVLVAIPACGEDDEASPPPSGNPEVSGAPAEVSGVEPASPERATSCLERAGFEVKPTGAAGPDVIELITIAIDDGDGTVNYYTREEDAFDAEVAGLTAQEPHSLVGRVGTALYAFELESGLERTGERIRDCLL